MKADFLLTSILSLLPSSLPAIPAPAQFWALIVWFVLPSIIGIWAAYAHHISRMRRASRRVRQLEIRLAASRPNSPIASSSTIADSLTAPLPLLPTPSGVSFLKSIPVLPRVPLESLKTGLSKARSQYQKDQVLNKENLEGMNSSGG